MKNKKILIISHYYKHKNAMASVRAIKLAKYFDKLGYKVTVLCSMQRDEWCKQNAEPVSSESIHEIYAPEASVIKWLYRFYGIIAKHGKKRARKAQQKETQAEHINAETKSKTSFLKGIKTAGRSFLSWLFYFCSELIENYILYKSFIKSFKKNKLGRFDYVIATYPGAASHLAGVWMKKHKKCQQFIADYRDPAYNPGARSRKIEAYFDKKLQDKTLKIADKAVCVSEGMASALRISSMRNNKKPLNVFVIHNGYDPEDFKDEYCISFPHDKVTFVYTGTLYNGRRCVDMLAEVLLDLINEEKIGRDSFCFEYAGPDYDVLTNQLQKYGLENTARDNGYVSREVSLAMQKSADAVLFLNWNDSNYRGVIPGKLYEYMASGTNIIALITGNEAGSESGEIINECKCGIVCEEATRDLSVLKKYTEEIFTAKRDGSLKKVKKPQTEKYSYMNIVLEYRKCLQTEGFYTGI